MTPEPYELGGAHDPVAVRVDARTGLPVALADRSEPSLAMPLELAITVVTGGDEALGPIGGLVYPGAERQRLDDLRVMRVASDDAGAARRHVVAAVSGDWAVELEYRFAERSPHVAFGFTLRRAEGAAPVLVRDVELALTLRLGDAGDWTVNAPGNQLRADVDVAALRGRVGLHTPGDTLGSPGIVAFSRRSAAQTAVAWPLCTTELGTLDLDRDGSAARFLLSTEVAGRLAAGEPGLAWGTLHLDLLGADWPAVRGALPAWFEQVGLHAPADAPAWLAGARVYEVHVGASVFADGRRYQRYETAAAIEADLPRIRALGFDAIQLMPRHPYPSYNVHDYADVTTTYGDEAEVRSLVAACHRLGMRVLLDVILHGVVDQEVVDETVAAVQAGPYAERLGDGTLDYLSRTAEDVAWSRHIVEYGPDWRAGSPPRHPLADAHPEWFMRDSAGRITRRYTKAFDIAHPGWQRHFLDACVALVERLGVDGFRVDAPTYNQFATWAPDRAARASYGAMASLGLLRDLRRRLRAIDPELAVYTEPTGALFRAVADATYNYDEHWLVESLLGPAHADAAWRLVRDGRELGRWLRDRDAALPPGSAIVHHIDSHDSIWWRLPGAQWRRERFGPEATVALLAVFAFVGGGFMTFMGGEDEVEDALRRAHHLRRRLPELARGMVDYAGATASADEVFVVLRRAEAAASVVAVNLSDRPVACELAVPGRRLGTAWHDAWSGEDVPVAAPARIAFAPFQPRVLRLP